MSGLGHYLEIEGLATVSISLVREHTERIVPPRALWVPFEFGRPLGVPGDAAFQGRVLLAALRLLEADAGPVLVDYPEDVPDPVDFDDTEGWVCPVDFAPPAAFADDDEMTKALLGEIAELQPWYNLGTERRGRTMVGVSGLAPNEAGRFLCAFIDGTAETDAWPDLRPGDVLKLVLMDVKAYYLEAAMARPGRASSDKLDNWFWGETVGSRVFLALRRFLLDSDDEFLQTLGKTYVIPRSQMHHL